MLLQRDIFQGAFPKPIASQVFSAHTLPATILTLGNAETRMYIALPLKLLTCVLPRWTQSLANYGKNCIHYVQAEWNLSIEQICSKMVVSEPWTECEHLGQNVTDVHEALLLCPITILIYDPSPYETAYDHHGAIVKRQDWNRSWSCSHYAAAAANPLFHIWIHIWTIVFTSFLNRYCDMAPAIWKSKWFWDEKL